MLHGSSLVCAVSIQYTSMSWRDEADVTRFADASKTRDGHQDEEN